MPEPARESRPAVLELLQDWQEAGAHWQVIGWQRTEVTVALLRCDGGEEVDRVTSTDPAVIAHLQVHHRSQPRT